MSTRASIIVKQGETKRYIRRHCDGYPGFLGIIVQSYLAKNTVDNKYNLTTDEIVDGICNGGLQCRNMVKECLHEERTGEYIEIWEEDTQCTECDYVMGDAEFVYVIDCDNSTFTCYKHQWDETEDECIREDRIVEI